MDTIILICGKVILEKDVSIIHFKLNLYDFVIHKIWVMMSSFRIFQECRYNMASYMLCNKTGKYTNAQRT